MRKMLSWTLSGVMAVLLLSATDAGAQSGAGIRAIRGAAAVQGISRAARAGQAIKIPAARAPQLGRAAAAAASGRSMLADQARRGSPQGGMISRHGIRPPANSGRVPGGSARVPAGDLGRYLTEGNLTELQQYLGGANLNDLARYLPYAYGNGAVPGYGGYGYYNDYYRHQDNMADAYRDASIANAIVNMVGIVATTAMQDQYRNVPVAAAPVVAPQVSPAYEMQKVVVQEGYYVSEQVWVPERQDPSTGSIIEAHQEMHKRWVPPVYELRQVQVR